jgi:ParB-like chromosome segregation protein Spo0J/DNA modification methylase
MQIKEIEVSKLIPYANNSRTHDDAQVAQLAASIKEFGFRNPILVDGVGIIAGHGRLMAARKLGLDKVPTIDCSDMTETQKKAYIIADNKLALNASWDNELLALEFNNLLADNFSLELLGFDQEEIDALLKEDKYVDTSVSGNLANKFGVPPFSILDTRKGEWQDRKRKWNSLIGDNGESRQNTLAAKDSLVAELNDGVSILDASLAEIVCNWFTKPEYVAFDPFAGDSVFGFVACSLGLNFVGIELREEQAKLNQDRLDKAELSGVYKCDTSENMDVYVKDNTIDFVFSCPPYADLEIYSDNPKDLSNMSHDEFFNIYKTIISKTYKKLKNNRFAVIVISEVRNKHGEYIGLIPKTIDIMCNAGYHYWNEIILINTAGTLPQRAAKSMNASRKVGRMHQNVLVFYKGDAKNIKTEFGNVELNLTEYLDE